MTELYLEDFTAGQTFETGDLTVSAEEIMRFARDFDPQPFHLDAQAAKATFFGDLAASGWHTAALTMRLMVDSAFRPAGGIIGAGFEEMTWPRPVRAGDTLHVTMEILDVRPSKSRPGQGLIKVRSTTSNQHGDTVQRSVGNLLVRARGSEGRA